MRALPLFPHQEIGPDHEIAEGEDGKPAPSVSDDAMRQGGTRYRMRACLC